MADPLRRALCAGLLAAGALPAPSRAQPGVSEREIVLGQIIDLSGPLAGITPDIVHGSKAWFDSQSARAPTPAGPPGPPPKWKLWLVNSGAVFPPVFLFNQAILPYLNDLNPLFRTLLLCLTVAAIVTWILMPRLQRFLKKWLYPPLQALRGRHKRRTA